MMKYILTITLSVNLLLANEIDNVIMKSLEERLTVKSAGLNMQFVKNAEKYKTINKSQIIYKLEVVKNIWNHGMKEYEEIKTPYYILVDSASFQNDKLYYNAYKIEDINKVLKKNTIDLSSLRHIN